MLNIVIFGAPGSGKGTNSALIVEAFKFDHISTGDVLRSEIKNGTPQVFTFAPPAKRNLLAVPRLQIH